MPRRPPGGGNPPDPPVPATGITPAARSQQASASSSRGLAPVAWGGIGAISATLAATALFVGTRYGYHRDELYFMACGQRLAWGYVDQPPFTPAVARLAAEVFGNSLPGLRVFPALAGVVLLVLIALLVRELGGNARAQLIAAGTAALIPLFHSPAMVLSTTSFDLVAWAACLVLTARLLRTGDDRLWLAIGAVAGVGLLNKHAVVFLGIGLVAGFLLSSQRSLLLRPTALAGGLLALAIWTPNLWWQHRHGWPVFEMSRALQAKNASMLDMTLTLPGLLVLAGITSVVIWGPGLWWLLRSPDGVRFRALGGLVLTVTVIMTLLGGKSYYLAPAVIPPLAAGSVLIARQDLVLRRAAVAAAVAAGLFTLPFSVPVLPAAALGPIISVNGEFGEMYGWPELTDQLSDAYRRLAPTERAHTVVLTANYGEHGAVVHYGESRGLPEPYSGHNDLWWWGPPPETTTAVVAVGLPPETLQELFHSIEVVGFVTNPAGLDNEEAGEPIAIARGPRADWGTIWPKLRHYG
jgi:hypothetical protein